MPLYDDIDGALPPISLLPPLDDASTLRWPWDPPPAQPAPVAADPSAAAVVPAPPAPPAPPVIGPPTEADALAAPLQPPPAPPDAQAPPPIPLPPIDEPAPLDPFATAVPPPPPPPQPFGPPTAANAAPPIPPGAPAPGSFLGIPASALEAGNEAALNRDNPLRETSAGPALTDEEAGRLIASLPPEKQAEIQAKFDAAKAQDLATKQLEISTKNAIAAQNNADAYKKAMQVAQQKQDQLEAESKQLAATHIDPGGGLSGSQKVFGVLGAVVGGLVSGRTGGPNEGLAMLNHAIDRGIEAQKAELANKRGLLTQRQSAVGEMFARTGDMYRSAETARVAAWETAIGQLQAEQLKYDPHGTTALRIGAAISGARAQQAAAVSSYAQQGFKNAIEIDKARQEALKNAEIERHNRAMEGIDLFKAKPGQGGSGVGAGGVRTLGAAPKYTVDTGLTNPFDASQPLFGVRQLGGKGEDPKERASVENAINSYAHAQDGWARLAAIGAKIDYHKSLGQSVWERFKSTDAAEYEAATHSLVVHLTKELGDKLTQGQIDEQGKRIPQLASWFESRDVGKMIHDSQEEADQALSRDLTLYGVDPRPVITSAQRARAVAIPSADQELDAAQAAATTNPTDKDAQAALEAAQERKKAETAAEQQRTTDIKTARSLPAPPELLREEASRPTDELAAIREANRATSRYADLYHKFYVEAGTTGYRKGLQRGELAAADRAQEIKIGNLATEVLKAHDFAEQQRATAHEIAGKHALEERARRAGLDPAEARARVRTGAIDPETLQPPQAHETPAPAPYNPLLPDRSFAPGFDPFGPQSNTDRLPALAPTPTKKRKR